MRPGSRPRRQPDVPGCVDHRRREVEDASTAGRRPRGRIDRGPARARRLGQGHARRPPRGGRGGRLTPLASRVSGNRRATRSVKSAWCDGGWQGSSWSECSPAARVRDDRTDTTQGPTSTDSSDDTDDVPVTIDGVPVTPRRSDPPAGADRSAAERGPRVDDARRTAGVARRHTAHAPTRSTAVLARLPEWAVPADDVETFNRPADSLKPPLVGDTIDTPFPPPEVPTPHRPRRRSAARHPVSAGGPGRHRSLPHGDLRPADGRAGDARAARPVRRPGRRSLRRSTVAGAGSARARCGSK